MNYKRKHERGLFDEEYRLKKISETNDPLEKLNRRIDWEIFRPLLEGQLKKENRGQGGCRPYDYVMMFPGKLEKKVSHS